MKRFNGLLISGTILIAVLWGCSGKSGKTVDTQKEEVSLPAPAPVVGNETKLLLDELVATGDYVNSLQFPSLIKASLVNEATAGNNLIIDLRPASSYSKGHIKGAVSKNFEELPAFFETGIRPFEYEKIILVCDAGQISSYVTCLLRLKGYGNVFALRWGMSSWNSELASEGWLKNMSGRFESSLDTVTHLKPAAGRMPDPGTGLTTGKEIADARFARLFSEGTNSAVISAEELFANPSAYYVINLERKDKYESGHIPGAVRYKPDGTLGITGEMATIPFDKPVVVYCGTGHNSAFATAYLRLFGYDARTLKYGNSSFMYDKMLKEKAALSWLPFSNADVNDFALVK